MRGKRTDSADCARPELSIKPAECRSRPLADAVWRTDTASSKTPHARNLFTSATCENTFKKLIQNIP